MKRIKKVKIEPLRTTRGGVARNHYVIYTEDGKYLSSYGRIVVYIPNDPSEKTALDKNFYDFSKTTSTYRNIFLKIPSPSVRASIDKGMFLLTNLNQRAGR